jgi:hypothetical protein
VTDIDRRRVIMAGASIALLVVGVTPASATGPEMMHTVLSFGRDPAGIPYTPQDARMWHVGYVGFVRPTPERIEFGEVTTCEQRSDGCFEIDIKILREDDPKWPDEGGARLEWRRLRAEFD